MHETNLRPSCRIKGLLVWGVVIFGAFIIWRIETPRQYSFIDKLGCKLKPIEPVMTWNGSKYVEIQRYSVKSELGNVVTAMKADLLPEGWKVARSLSPAVTGGEGGSLPQGWSFTRSGDVYSIGPGYGEADDLVLTVQTSPTWFEDQCLAVRRLLKL